MMHIVCYLRQGSDVLRLIGRRYAASRRWIHYRLLDLTVYGRQEAWEDSPLGWRNRHHGTLRSMDVPPRVARLKAGFSDDLTRTRPNRHRKLHRRLLVRANEALHLSKFVESYRAKGHSHSKARKFRTRVTICAPTMRGSRWPHRAKCRATSMIISVLLCIQYQRERDEAGRLRARQFGKFQC